MSTNYGFLGTLLTELGNQKRAAARKQADEPLSEAGSYQGGTSHPSKNVDDHTIVATTGARASENERDVENNREKPTVNSTPEATAQAGSGSQDEHQLNIGTTQSATGEDPSVEDHFKGTKDDPGTTSKMDAEGAAKGEKYSAYRQMPAQKLASHVIDLSNSLLADIAVQQKQGASATLAPSAAAAVGQPARPPAGSVAPAASATPAVNAAAPTANALKVAAEAGYAAAAALGAPADRQAEAHQLLSATVKEAAHQAELVAQYLYNRHAKLAADGDDGSSGEDHSKPGDGGSGSGTHSSISGAPGGGGSGGGDPGGPAGPAGMPGMPPAGGGDPTLDPTAAAGGPPPGPGGDPTGGAGGVSEDQAIQELAAALLEMGIDPQQVADAAAAQAGGPAPKMGSAEYHQVKQAMARVTQLRRSGKFAFAAPRNAKLAKVRQDMRSYLAEVLAGA